MKLTNEKPLTSVRDNGRRGQPLPACDCVQCFGYCRIGTDDRWHTLTQQQDRPVSAPTITAAPSRVPHVSLGNGGRRVLPATRDE